MSRRMAVLAAFAVLVGCSGEPSKVTPPKLLPGDEREVVSVCFNAHTATEAALAQEAQKQCEDPRASVVFLSEDRIFNPCPMNSKLRANYVCEVPPGLPPLPKNQLRRKDDQ
ncbi:MAG: hypothetical protein AB7G39_14045 [Alphaproteobacteria bacterium]